MPFYYLACDLGAESGRLMLGMLRDGRLSLEELHRFPNTPLQRSGSLQWDIPRLFHELKTGLRKAAALNVPIASISTDSWGVDYVLFDSAGRLLAPVFHYRDPRTARGVQNVLGRVPWPEIFAESGIQFMPLNTIFQLGAEDPARLEKASFLLSVGDAFNYLLGGRAVVERSMASTFQLYSPVAGAWSPKLAAAAQLPLKLLPEIVSSGELIGNLSGAIAEETGLPPARIVATCSHDTGAAVFAVPGKGHNWAYLSSGTWSLLGVELSAPVLTEACREFNFTNEIGHHNSVRLLKNIAGLWLLQESRRHWTAEGKSFDYETLSRMAEEAGPAKSWINPADERFLPPGDMPGRIAAFCRETGQAPPGNEAQTVRIILESLALIYARTLQQADTLAGWKSFVLHVVGGGCKNALLNQLTADAIGIPVLAGPAEATAAGNVLTQAVALGHLGSWAEARECVRNSFELRTFFPRSHPKAAAERFAQFFRS